MSKLFNKGWFWYLSYLAIAIIGIWFLTKSWIPTGHAIVGHDSGLALNTGEFLKTRFFAWDDRIGFGVDNSPHFGSIILHSIDYVLSLASKEPYAGSQVAVFFWMSLLFIFSAIFSYSLRQKLGKLFPYFFPIFLIFNFFIFQSIFILERAKYELICVILLFLTLGLAVLFDKKKSILQSSIIFSLVFSIFNGGSWLGLPLYGGLLVSGITYLLFTIAVSVKEKDFGNFKRALIFSFLNVIFFVFLNLYSLLPFVSTLINSDYAKVVSQGTIAAGKEWLDYISRGSSWLNLFRFQGVPEWYLTGGLPNPDYTFAGLYLTNSVLVLISFLLPILSFVGIIFSKEKTEKYLISFFIFLLLFSMFFASGTNSPLGFIYTFLYEKIPGFSIFRSPYYKFSNSYIISFAVILSYSLSKIEEFTSNKIRGHFFNKFKVQPFIVSLLFVLSVIIVWFSYYFVVFNRDNLFKWQPDKSTLVKIPDYVEEFNSWLKDTNFDGRTLIIPAFDGDSGNDFYTWGYWSLSPLPSVLSSKGNFIVNEVSNNPFESDWVNKAYLLLLQKNPAFLDISNKLGIKYVFFRNDFLPQNQKLQEDYLEAVKWFTKNDDLKLVKSFGPWSIYSIERSNKDGTFKFTNNIFSIPKEHRFLAKELLTPNYINGYWVNLENKNNNLKNLISQEFYSLICDSCLVENLGKYTNFPSVRILPNSPLYAIKKKINEKSLVDSIDDNSRLGVYLGLSMIKLSEVRSMYAQKIERQFIEQGMKDINEYLKNINEIISNSGSLRSNFYFASRVYETMNPIQRYFRDYVNNYDFGLEKPIIKEEIFKALWQSVSIKRQFDGLIGEGDRWNYEKIFNLNLPDDGQYQLMVDAETLPSDSKGNYIYPSRLVVESSNNSLDIKSIDDSRWLFTDMSNFSKKDQFQMAFQNLPNLFQSDGLKRVDFPAGVRGCLVGKISSFNKNRNYKFIVSSEDRSINMRFYIKEDSSHNVSTNGFLLGDIEIDVTLNADGDVFTYIYSPTRQATSSQVYLCRYDDTLPKNIKVDIRETFVPSVYVIKRKDNKTIDVKVNYKKLDPTRYDITTDNLTTDMVLIFNQAFNSSWKLYDENDNYSNAGKSSFNHFVIDGYANAWLLPGGKKYNLSLVYEPQILFEKGTKISIFAAVVLSVMYVISSIKRKNNEKI